MIATELKLGQSIELQIERDGYIYRLISKVEGTDRNKIYISLITAADRVFRFENVDSVMAVCHVRERMWAWTNVTGKVELLDGERVHALYVNGEAESYNRREAFRVSIGKECDMIHHRYVKNPEKKEYTDQMNEAFRAVIKDISENGVAVVTERELQNDDFLEFVFENEGAELKCEAKVVRSMAVEGSYAKRLYGCVLTKSSKELGKHVFDIQRRQLQNLRTGR